MRTLRFYCESITGPEISLTGPDFRHITKVLRLAVGDEVTLFDGKGKNGHGQIISADKKTINIKLGNIVKQPPRQIGRIIIASGIAKSDRFETIIAKCTELGIDSIVPVIYERTVKQATGKNTVQRYEKIALESAKQCGRNLLPKIMPPKPFSQTIEDLKKEYPKANLMFGSLGTEAKSIASLKFDFDSEDVIVFIGPEGGFTETEEKFLTNLVAVPVRLTDTVLRIETAAITAGAYLTIKRNYIINE